MFPLHESTQRKLCRVAFVALCVAPTTLLLLYGLRLHTPGYRAAVASELAQQAGVDISLDDLVFPRPGHTRLSHVRIVDPETGSEVASIRELEIVENGSQITLRAAQPRSDARHFDLLWRRFDERVLRGGPASANRIELRAADVTLTSPDAESQTLRHVLLVVARDKGETSVQLQYGVAGIAMPEPAVLRIARKKTSAGKYAVQLAWHTGGAALPVAPWASKFPWLKHVGKHCHFRGELTAEDSPKGWRGSLSGELSRIALDDLVSDQFPHKLSGEARAIIQAARFERGQLVSAQGHIEAGPGVIGQSLVASAAEQFQLERAGNLPANLQSDALRRYSQLTLCFTLDDQKLMLRGECEKQAERTLLVLDGEQYQTPAEPSASTLSLVRLLSPASDHQVPATAATRRLIEVLPLPKEVRQAETETPRGHLRGDE